MKFLVFLGSIRKSTPPIPERLGLRVALACVAEINESGNQAELIDPLDLDFDEIFKPHFSYAKGSAPAKIESLAQKIQAADGYIMISPEYNHSMSPALAHMLNHFGSSLFSYKPSAIVTYSAGQWGGVRAAINMRTYLSELGCLPVSAMIHIPKAAEVLSENGQFIKSKDAVSWQEYFGRTFSQLAWWSKAAKTLKSEENPQSTITSFKKDPSQRNAP
jgi:chromate reductase